MKEVTSQASLGRVSNGRIMETSFVFWPRLALIRLGTSCGSCLQQNLLCMAELTWVSKVGWRARCASCCLSAAWLAMEWLPLWLMYSSSVISAELFYPFCDFNSTGLDPQIRAISGTQSHANRFLCVQCFLEQTKNHPKWYFSKIERTFPSNGCCPSVAEKKLFRARPFDLKSLRAPTAAKRCCFSQQASIASCSSALPEATQCLLGQKLRPACENRDMSLAKLMKIWGKFCSTFVVPLLLMKYIWYSLPQ